MGKIREKIYSRFPILRPIGMGVGAAMAVVSPLLDVLGIEAQGLPVRAWVAIGLAIFFLSTAALVFGWGEDNEEDSQTSTERDIGDEGVSGYLSPGTKLDGETVHLAEIARHTSSIRDVTFRDCLLLGPAVLAPRGETVIVGNNLGANNPEEVFWLLDATQTDVRGVIALFDCSIVGCRFKDIGIVGSREAVQKWRDGTRVK